MSTITEKKFVGQEAAEQIVANTKAYTDAKLEEELVAITDEQIDTICGAVIYSASEVEL